MIESYQNKIGIEVKWLTDEAKLFSYDNLKKHIQRGNISRLRRGCRETTSLIDFDSMPDKYKEQIIALIGDPHNVAKHEYFRKFLVPDVKAIEYYANYTLDNGRLLPTLKAKEYHTNAMFLNAVHAVDNNTSAKRKAAGGKRTGIWQAISDVVNDLQEEYEHSLPTNYLRLKDRLKVYLENGYSSLIHKNYCNNNSRKVDEKLEMLILSIYIMNNKPLIQMVLDVYLEFLAGKIDIIDVTTGEMFLRSDFWNEDKGMYVMITTPTVWNYIRDPKNTPVLESRRNDFHYYNNRQRPHHHRSKPNYSLSKISLDDRDLVRKYKDTKGSLVRAKAYYAYDVTSGALIGYSHSKDKDSDLFTRCLSNMFNFLNRNEIGMPMEVEVEHHLVNQYKDDLMKGGVVFPFVRFCNPGNSQEKRAEHFMKAKKYGYEKRYQDGIGRYTLSEANRPKQDKEWNEDGMTVKEKVYNYDNLIADDIFTINKYNNDLHPNQKKFPKMSRMDVLLSNLNPSLAKYSSELIARYIGEKTETTIVRNQYVKVQYEKYQLPNLDVLARLQPNNYGVMAYYLPNEHGSIENVYLFQNDQYIGQCGKIIKYNESKAERTQADIDAALEQAKYVAQFDKKIKEDRKKLAKLEIIEKNTITEPDEVLIFEAPELFNDFDTEYIPTGNAVDDF